MILLSEFPICMEEDRQLFIGTFDDVCNETCSWWSDLKSLNILIDNEGRAKVIHIKMCAKIWFSEFCMVIDMSSMIM
jgi:hypothetical protein